MELKERAFSSLAEVNKHKTMKKLGCILSRIQNTQMSSEAANAVDTEVKATGVSFGPSVFSSLPVTFIESQPMVIDTSVPDNLLKKELPT